MSLISTLARQVVGVIQWNAPQDGVLAWRYPMRELEIQNGGQLTVSDSQMALFVHEGRIADVFGPGLYTLAPRNLPALAGLMNWERGFDEPFRSDVYFFSTRLQLDQKWGTETPITLRDRDFGAVRLRCFGNYGYRITDPRLFFNQASSIRPVYAVSDLEGQLRSTIVAHLAGVFSTSGLPLLNLAANQSLLGAEIGVHLKPIFAALGLELIQVGVEHISLPEELARALDQRKAAPAVSDLSRYTQFAASDSSDSVAFSGGFGFGAETSTAGGFGLSASAAISASASAVAVEAAPGTKFCNACGDSIPDRARFCCDCGKAQ